ncbi:MAG: hypothetical protein HPY83_11525 [Anaerolineae bacterium]|nr:hypothetical protein [Anaerolineae bacterium]
MPFHFGAWDAVLIVAVSVQATALAYLPQPRLKALAYVLPFPFTIATLALGRPVDATNVLGLLLLFGYIQGVRLLHDRLRLPIVAAILLSALSYTAAGWLMAPIVPASDGAFWAAVALSLALAATLYLRISHRDERAHRTTLPVWIKLPVVASVIVALVIVKEYLQGFMTLFPMVGVVGAYEARHSLWTMGRQIPTWMLAMIPMLVVIRLTQYGLGLPGALALGWVVFLAVLLPLTRRQWRRG